MPKTAKKKRSKKVEKFSDEKEEKQEVVEEKVDEVVEEQPEVIEEEETIETFKNQLVQALSLNDNLLTELKDRDMEISAFKEIKTSLESVIETQKNEITQLKNDMQNLQAEKHRERVEEAALRWIKKFGLPKEKLQEAIIMLSKYETEEELNNFVNLIDSGSRNDKSTTPVPATQSSAVLVETFSNAETEEKLRSMSGQDRRDYLFNQLKEREKLQNR